MLRCLPIARMVRDSLAPVPPLAACPCRSSAIAVPLQCQRPPSRGQCERIWHCKRHMTRVAEPHCTHFRRRKRHAGRIGVTTGKPGGYLSRDAFASRHAIQRGRDALRPFWRTWRPNGVTRRGAGRGCHVPKRGVFRPETGRARRRWPVGSFTERATEKEKMVEAAGIEPASGCRVLGPSTWVVVLSGSRFPRARQRAPWEPNRC